MVRISEVVVDVARNGNDLTATLTFDATFSEDERELNLEYSVWGVLYEVDGALDKYIIWPNGGGLLVQRAPQGNRDEFVTFLSGGTTRPEDGETQSFELTADIGDVVWTSGDDQYLVSSAGPGVIDEFGSESEFKAIATMIPSVSMAAAFSNMDRVEISQYIL